MNLIEQWALSKSVEIFAALSSALMHVMFAWKHPAIMARQAVICVLFAYWLGPVFGEVVTSHTFLTGERTYGACIALAGLSSVYAMEVLVVVWTKVQQDPALLLKVLPTWRKK